MFQKQVLGIALVCFAGALKAATTDKDVQAQHCVADYSGPSVAEVDPCQYTNKLYFSGLKAPSSIYALKEFSGRDILLPQRLPVFAVSLSQIGSISASETLTFWGEGLTSQQKQQICGLVSEREHSQLVFLLPVNGLSTTWEEETARKIYTGKLGLTFANEIPLNVQQRLIALMPQKVTSEYLNKILVVTEQTDSKKTRLNLASLQKKVEHYRAIESGRGQAFASCGKVVNVLD